MVTDDHQITYTEGLVDATSSVGDEEVLDTQELHHTDGEGDLLHRITLVVVEASLHAEHRDTRERTCNKVSLVTDGRRVREVRNLGIGDDRGVLEHIAELTQTATEDDSRLDILWQA